jgi:hypothetical protein
MNSFTVTSKKNSTIHGFLILKSKCIIPDETHES